MNIPESAHSRRCTPWKVTENTPAENDRKAQLEFARMENAYLQKMTEKSHPEK